MKCSMCEGEIPREGDAFLMGLGGECPDCTSAISVRETARLQAFADAAGCTPADITPALLMKLSEHAGTAWNKLDAAGLQQIKDCKRITSAFLIEEKLRSEAEKR